MTDGSAQPRVPARGRRRLGAALAAAGLLVALALWLWPIAVRRALERYFSAALATPVAIDRADVSWLRLAARLEGVTVPALLPGAEHPLLHATAVTVNFESLDDVWGDGPLRLDALVVEGAELASESIDGGPSTAGELQARLRARGEEKTAREERSSDASRTSADEARRLEIARLVARDVSLRAIDRRGTATRTSVASFAELDADGAAIPLGGDAVPEVGAIAFSGARLRLDGEGADDVAASVARTRIEASLAPARGDADELDVVVRDLDADGIDVEGRSEDDAPIGLTRLVEVWRAALRGLRVPGVASLTVTRAVLRDGRYAQRDASGGSVLALTSIALDVADLRHPQPDGQSGTVALRCRPLADDASLDVRARGAIGAPGGPAPVEVAARFAHLPLDRFRDLHLASGTTTGSADMIVQSGAAHGEATLRLTGLTAASDAPLALRTAYGSLRTVAGQETPAITVPFAVELRDPDLGRLARGIASALAVELARSATGDVVAATGRIGESAEGAAAELGEAARTTARDAADRVRRGVAGLFR